MIKQANTVTMLLQVRTGDIFNPATLQKIRQITDELYYIPAVDRFKITSLAVNTVVDMQLTSGGYTFVPIMFPHVPKTAAEAEELRQKVYSSVFYGGLVWFDSKKTLITADFFDDEIDYSAVFKELIRIQKKYEDDNHILSMAGEPLHLGYIDSYVGTTMTIMVITLVVMLLLFLYYFRSFRGMVLPVAASLISGIWGLGFLVLLGYNLDPLVLVFPFLVAAMAACGWLSRQALWSLVPGTPSLVALIVLGSLAVLVYIAVLWLRFPEVPSELRRLLRKKSATSEAS